MPIQKPLPIRPCCYESCPNMEKFWTARYCTDHYYLSKKFKYKTCSVANCSSRHIGLGFCYRHLHLFHTYGTPSAPPRPTLAERFWAKVDKTEGAGPNGDCWIWTAYCDPAGYGRFSISPKQSSQRATHVLWLVLYGSLPTEHILHSCDNPQCVNPDHLREGSPADNAKDKIERGRHPHIYTPSQIAEVRRLHKEGWSISAIAKTTGVKKSSVPQIYSGRQWTHV